MKFRKNKKGVFGLNAIQQFFAIILGIALLAYVIVIIMGTLQDTTILDKTSNSVYNETGAYINTTGYTLAQSGLTGFESIAIINAFNATSGNVIVPNNYTLNGSKLYSATDYAYSNVFIAYSYKQDSNIQLDIDSITSNTSSGVAGFFSDISPVYAILAVLVIILVLVVLVRVVQTPGRREETPQL